MRFTPNWPFQRANIENALASPNLGSQSATTPTVDELFNQDATAGTGYSAPAFLPAFRNRRRRLYAWIAGAALHSQLLSTQAFRQGLRGVNLNVGMNDPSFTTQLPALTMSQIETLAAPIAGLVKTKLTASGPFQNLEEFLSGNTVFGGKSLLERAIDDSLVNLPALGYTAAGRGHRSWASVR